MALGAFRFYCTASFVLKGAFTKCLEKRRTLVIFAGEEIWEACFMLKWKSCRACYDESEDGKDDSGRELHFEIGWDGEIEVGLEAIVIMEYGRGSRKGWRS